MESCSFDYGHKSRLLQVCCTEKEIENVTITITRYDDSNRAKETAKRQTFDLAEFMKLRTTTYTMKYDNGRYRYNIILANTLMVYEQNDLYADFIMGLRYPRHRYTFSLHDDEFAIKYLVGDICTIYNSNLTHIILMQDFLLKSKSTFELISFDDCDICIQSCSYGFKITHNDDNIYTVMEDKEVLEEFCGNAIIIYYTHLPRD